MNPCGDPPGGVGDADPADRRGRRAALAGHAHARATRPALDGAILRVDPDTGAGAARQPAGREPDPNARRIVAHGFRNPFRITFRPGTSEVWVGDVGWNEWEEIDRIADPTAGRRATSAGPATRAPAGMRPLRQR